MQFNLALQGFSKVSSMVYSMLRTRWLYHNTNRSFVVGCIINDIITQSKPLEVRYIKLLHCSHSPKTSPHIRFFMRTDSYVAVTGLPEPQPSHALLMARFATDCRIKMNELTAHLENRLGPDTGDLTYVSMFSSSASLPLGFATDFLLYHLQDAFWITFRSSYSWSSPR